MAKIKTMFDLAIANNNDAIVLGAFGCGAYHNPPSEIAKLFKEVIDNDGYKNKFSKIVFAIIDDKNSYRWHNPEGNLKPFIETFNINTK